MTTARAVCPEPHDGEWMRGVLDAIPCRFCGVPIGGPARGTVTVTLAPGERERIVRDVVAEFSKHYKGKYENAGLGGPGPLFRAGLITQYELDVEWWRAKLAALGAE